MDGTIKQSRRFAELERLSDDYFRYHLASVMDETRDYLARKQGEEMKEYSTSLGGVLSMMASSAQPLNDRTSCSKLPANGTPRQRKIM